MEHIDTMDDLKGSVGLQAYAQRDPVNEYRLQGFEMFEEMVADIRAEMMRILLSAVPRTQAVQRVQVAKPLTESFEGSAGQEKKKTIVVRKAEKVGRNDLCPCGSGKKYKKCCGAPANGGN
jgi:preprotein translocase subunit SecA